jgi:cobalamin-dependent methionine synthase I
MSSEPFNLTLIGESINDSVPSTNALFEADDLDGVLALAERQDAGGADYIDVNVGTRGPEFMARLIRRIQEITDKPLSIDTPDFETAKAGLEAYDSQKAGGERPILNSISPLRTAMFELLDIQPFRPVFLASERMADSGYAEACAGYEESYQTAAEMRFFASRCGLENDDLIFDPGIPPAATDTEGGLRRVIETLRKMHDDPEFEGVHASVGLSNFTVMLPPKRSDGSPVKGPLESAFLTVAVPLGLDTIIGSVKRKYERLDENHPAARCVAKMLDAGGFDSLLAVKDFYEGVD